MSKKFNSDLTPQGTKERILNYLSENTPVNYYDLKVVEKWMDEMKTAIEDKRKRLIADCHTHIRLAKKSQG